MFVESLLLLILVSLWLGLYQIVKQQGRMILRLDALEQSGAVVESSEPEGLEVGSEFPSFSFSDLKGTRVSLEDFGGKRVLLVHWNPGCGFCDLIAPDLARLQTDFEKHNLQLLLLAHGEAEANRKLAEEHGLKCPILLYKDAQVPKPLANLGTPSAYLLDAESRVAKPLAVGSEQVPALAEEATNDDSAAIEIAGQGDGKSKRLAGKKPLDASRILRDGLKAGTPAPSFTLLDIYGETISLDSYRGRRVLLVFSDPKCGPCDQVAGELARFDGKHADSGLTIVMVGRGDPQENRKKAEQHGINFPVVIQEKWRLSKEYGIFSAPVAFLIDEDGVIAKDVAIGPEPIMTLAKEGLKPQKESEYELSYR